MYQSVPSLTIPPGNFLEERIPHPQAQRKCENPTPGAEKSCQNPTLAAIIIKNTAKKNTKHETKIMKNSTEMLTCLEILKQ